MGRRAVRGTARHRTRPNEAERGRLPRVPSRRGATLPLRTHGSPALVAQGIEHRPPEPCAQVRILPRALPATGQRSQRPLDAVPTRRSLIRTERLPVPRRRSAHAGPAAQPRGGGGAPLASHGAALRRRAPDESACCALRPRTIQTHRRPARRGPAPSPGEPSSTAAERRRESQGAERVNACKCYDVNAHRARPHRSPAPSRVGWAAPPEATP
jgi:hypothetical protein